MLSKPINRRPHWPITAAVQQSVPMVTPGFSRTTTQTAHLEGFRGQIGVTRMSSECQSDTRQTSNQQPQHFLSWAQISVISGCQKSTFFTNVHWAETDQQISKLHKRLPKDPSLYFFNFWSVWCEQLLYLQDTLHCRTTVSDQFEKGVPQGSILGPLKYIYFFHISSAICTVFLMIPSCTPSALLHLLISKHH